jgi:hypothetical protein
MTPELGRMYSTSTVRNNSVELGNRTQGRRSPMSHQPGIWTADLSSIFGSICVINHRVNIYRYPGESLYIHVDKYFYVPRGDNFGSCNYLSYGVVIFALWNPASQPLVGSQQRSQSIITVWDARAFSTTQVISRESEDHEHT